VDDEKCANVGTLGMLVVGSVVVAFMILVEWHVLRRSWLDAIGPILFLLSLITQSFSIIILQTFLDLSLSKIFIFTICSITISFGGIVVSMWPPY
jgi:hypothetical protein